jgi:hypothetical protein
MTGSHEARGSIPLSSTKRNKRAAHAARFVFAPVFFNDIGIHLMIDKRCSIFQFHQGCAPASVLLRRIFEAAYQRVFGEQRTHTRFLNTGSLAVYDAHAHNSFFMAKRKVVLQQIGKIPGMKGMKIQHAVDGNFNRFHRVNL